MSRRTVVGGAFSIAAAGAATGIAARRYAVGRARLRPDPDAREPFFALPADRVREVEASDGVRLHVEEIGPADADLTVIFCHGYTQEQAVWHYQRQALAQDPAGKLVFWDHRSHGRSARSTPERSTIDQLGDDLYALLEATAPRGPVVLVGHSMGGMTIMALADARPELFGTRVQAVALLATSAGKLAEVTFGFPAVARPAAKLALPYVTRRIQSRPQPFERGRMLGADVAYLLSKRIAFGENPVTPSLVAFVEQLTAATPMDVIADFFETFMSHDKLRALPALHDVDTLVLCGTADKITPVEHSREIAAQLPDAQLVVVEGAGHMVMLERPPLVTLHLQALIAQVVGREQA